MDGPRRAPRCRFGRHAVAAVGVLSAFGLAVAAPAVAVAAPAGPAVAAAAVAAPVVAGSAVAEHLGPGGRAGQVAAADVPAVPGPNSPVTITGAGFGHGVGMSQYGAYGMAKAGASVGAILEHYYTGTTVTGYPDDIDVRVNVVDRGTQVTLRTSPLAAGGGAFRLTATDGSTIALGSGDVAVVTPVAGGVAVAVTRASGAPSALTTTALAVAWSGARGLTGPASLLRVDSLSTTTSAVKERRYRWGSLVLAAVDRTDPDGTVRPRIEATAVLGLHDEYLRGIDEVPASWPVAALEAQVVAARNYALGERGHTQPGCGGCTLWDDTRSQVYRGWDAESGYWGARWAAAVTATETSSDDGLTVLYDGSPITAYYASSTGGRTRDASSVWGTAVPYLRSVDDPWSVDPAINPSYASWTRTVALSRVEALFGLGDIVALAVTERDTGGAALTVRATSSTGTSRSLPGATLCSAFGLPAQWLSSLTIG